MELKIDPKRLWMEDKETGIFVRAKNGDKWDNFDIVYLDTKSLLTWLKSRGGSNKWAEDTVCIILGHEPYGTHP